MANKAPRIIQYGNDLYREITYPDTREPLKITYWDMWLVIILTNTFTGDWDKMIDYMRERKKKSISERNAFEGLLNHLYFLRHTLDEAGLEPTDVLLGINADFLKKQEAKAKRKILEVNFYPDERSSWMINTPRKFHKEQAMRGYWNRFSVYPQKYAKSLERLYKSSGFYSENQSFSLERKLSAFIEKHEQQASSAELIALYRAFLTVVIEKMDMVDDSYGVIGDLYVNVFKAYFQLDRVTLDMTPSDFFLDLIELLIWEDYGLTDEQKPQFFDNLTSSEYPIVESILKAKFDELNELDLQYQAENALTMLGMLYVQHQIFEKFVPMAKVMGTRAWQRITTMSEVAEKHQKYDIALSVYEACLSPGFHEKFLREKYTELKKRLSLRENL